MINRILLLTAFAITPSVAMLSGCTKGVHGGAPALPLSTTNGTTVVFSDSEKTVLTAISNVFAFNNTNMMGYRGMMLSDASGEPGPTGQYTNGFVLTPVEGPVALIPLTGGRPKLVPYSAYFNIVTKSLDNTTTAVTVRTFSSEVMDGKESPIQGGWVNHYRDVPPVKAEEENILSAISNALVALRVQEKPDR